MSLLDTIKTKKVIKPLCVLFYGVHGIGKTSFAAGAEKPIFVGVEENTEFDVPRFPKVTSWDGLKDQLNTLLKEKHDFRTLVIDTIDGLEDIAQTKILTGKNAGKNMETACGGYGKAYIEMAEMFIDLRDNYLEKLRDKGMQIIILAHSEKNKFEDPMLAISYDTYSTSCHKRVKPIVQDWVQTILFANYDLVRAENNQGKEYAESLDGKRVIYTEERPSHVAKNRFDLPYEMDFPKVGAWATFKRMVWNFYQSTGAEMFKPVESVPEQTQPEQTQPVKEEKKVSSEWTRLRNEADKLLAKMEEKNLDQLVIDQCRNGLERADKAHEEKGDEVLPGLEKLITKMKATIV